MSLFNLLSYAYQHLKLSTCIRIVIKKRLTPSLGELVPEDWMQPWLFMQLTASKCYCAGNKLGWDKWELVLYFQRDV